MASTAPAMASTAPACEASNTNVDVVRICQGMLSDYMLRVPNAVLMCVLLLVLLVVLFSYLLAIYYLLVIGYLFVICRILGLHLFVFLNYR
jgi:uncharacterized membrane protein YdbT with pleckstrin-like domain